MLNTLVTTGKATNKMPNPSQCDNVKEIFWGRVFTYRQSPTLWLTIRHGSSAHTRTSVQYKILAKTDKLPVPGGELRGHFPPKCSTNKKRG